MSGKLLIVAGFPCSGKTTYISEINKFFGNIIGRRDFYTNRPPRSEEERLNSIDYTFIASSKYAELSNLPNWHWAIWFGFNYGFNIPSEITRLQEGENIVIGTAPHVSYLSDMQRIHGKNNVRSILLYVDYEIILDRLKKRPRHEHKRILEFDQFEIDNYAKKADIVFVPKNKLLDDCNEFIRIVAQMI